MIVFFPSHCFSIYFKPDQTLKTLTLSLVNVILRLVDLNSVIMAISECLKLYFCIFVYFFCAVSRYKQRTVASFIPCARRN